MSEFSRAVARSTAIPSPGEVLTVVMREIGLLRIELGKTFRFIHNDSRLDTDLEMDDCDAVDMFMRLEDRFQIDILEADAEALLTVAEVAAMVSVCIERKRWLASGSKSSSLERSLRQ